MVAQGHPRVIVVTGGRDRTPTLAELESLLGLLSQLRATHVRHGAARGTDSAVAAWLRARTELVVEPWPAEDHGEWPWCGAVRNEAMLDGDGLGDLFGESKKPAAVALVAFAGGDGTQNCIDAAGARGIPISPVEPVEEPRPWNMHWDDHPETLVYCGRSRQWGGPSPLANPYRVTSRDRASEHAVLERYRSWLWSRIAPGRQDPQVLEALAALTKTSYVGCTCWPRRCHTEVVIRAWRWLESTAAR